MTAYNPSIQHPTVWQRIVQSIAEVAQRATEEAARARRQRKLMRELEELDDHMLRDIGVRRAEIGSIVAEVVGASPATRRRVMQPANRAETA
jgi:uncharacterized protein YjiS (DUF1127 family)